MGNSRTSFISRLVRPFLPAAPERLGAPDASNAPQERLDVVAQLAECLILGDDLEAMLEGAFAAVSPALRERRLTAYKLEPDGQSLVMVASNGIEPAQRAALARLPLDGTLCGRVVTGRAPVVRARLDADPDPLAARARALGLLAFAGFPLTAGERMLGVLVFCSRLEPDFAPGELTLMQTVAVQVAAAMERIRAQRATLESETRLRMALEAGGMAAWSWDRTEQVLHPDAQLLRLYGLDPAETSVADGDALMSRVHPEDRAALQAAASSAVQGHDMHCDYRVVLPGDGPGGTQTRWLSTHAQPVADAEGRVTSLIGLTQDVTDAVIAREGLEREAAQHERVVEHQAAALAESEARLAEASKMEALGRLAGGIAHDFNNVLQAVEGSASLALRSMDTDPETARRFLRLAAEACARGAAVTERLLAFGRRSPLRTGPIDASALLEGLAEMLRPTIGSRILVRVECAPDLPPLLADRNRLEAVLVNLANNARDAMPDGGRLVLAADMDPAGTDRAGPSAPHLRLRVIDEGEGMAPETLQRVSQPFFTTKPMGRGTGLGLAMARGFAEQSGGAFAIESALGRGTTVTIALPLARPAPAEAFASGGAPAMARGMSEPASAWPVASHNLPAAILLVEDRPDLRTILAAELSDGGHSVTAVEDAAAALALIGGGYRPRAMVADLGLAGRHDGIALLAEARTRLPRLPGLVITGHLPAGAADRLATAAQGGPFAILRKPASGDALRDRVAQVLSQAGSPATREAEASPLA